MSSPTSLSPLAAPRTMRAVVLDGPGGPERLVYRERPTPEAGAGEALLRMSAAGVNFIDVYHRRGTYPVPDGTVLGWEGVGRDLSDGRRYAFFDHLGSYAEYAAVPRSKLIALPEDVGDDGALALFQGITAQYLTDSIHPLREGETVLVTAAAGGVGLHLLQFAAAAGARAIGVVSRPEKAELVRAAGAVPLVSPNDAFADAVRAIAPNGVDVAFDANGAATWEATLASVRTRGHIVLFGAAGTPIAPIDPALLRERGSLTLTYSSVFDHIREPEERAERVVRFFDAVRTRRIRIAPPTRFPLADAAAAHRLLESRASTGKIVLDAPSP
jgi:NADPH:quinone reductase